MSKYKVEITGINTNNLIKLKHEEMVKLFKEYKNGNLKAKEKIIEGNLRLVLSLVSKLSNSKFNMDDLFQIGCVGLVKAVDNFDLSHNVMFSTYAVPMISGEIKRYIRDNNTLRISRSINENAYKIIKFTSEFEKNNNREPTDEEIKKELGLEPYEISIALDSLKEPMSMSEPIYSNNGDSIYLEDQVKDEKASKHINEIIELRRALENLTKREKLIIYKRYIYGLTQSELAKDLDISQAQISRLEKSALQNIKRQIM